MAEPKISLCDFVPEDAEGLVACIREEYGESYLRRAYYRADCLRQEAAHGGTHFLVAKSAGEVAGMLALHLAGGAGTIATGIVRKAYRGAGIMQRLFQRAIEKAKALGAHALLCRGVAYHDITQRRLEELGFSPTALLMAEFLTEGQYSYEKDANEKHPHVLLVKNLRADEPQAAIFVPAACAEAAKKTYAALEKPVEIRTARHVLFGKSEISTEYDDGQCCTSIFIHRAGSDIKERVQEIERSRKGRLETANVFLNIGREEAVAAYEALLSAGCFFTGFFPLFYDEEYMVLHNAMDVPIHWDSFVLSRKASELRCFIRSIGEEGAS